MPFWHRIVIAAAVFLVVTIVARVVDWGLARKPVPPEVETRYRVLRRAVTTTIIAVGLFSALLVIPEIRAVAGALLASMMVVVTARDRKSTRLNSSHRCISYAVVC